MPARSIVFGLAVALCSLAIASPAAGSEQFGDVDVAFSSLEVDARGEALVTYRTSAHVLRHVYVWGAINAIPPDPSVRQVHFRFDYSGGWSKDGRRDLVDVPEPLPPLRRTEARLARGGMQGAGRLVLGTSALAAPVADAWRRAVPPRAGVVRASCLALVGASARARGLAELDLRRQVAGPFRPPHLPRSPVFGFAPRRRAGGIPTHASSTSTPSTRSSGRGGSTMPARSRTTATARSATASCPSSRRPAIRRGS